MYTELKLIKDGKHQDELHRASL